MSPNRRTNWAASLNLVIPGAGLILVGRLWTGLAVGLVFVVCANLALWATLLVSDEFSPWSAGLAIGLAGGTYVGAQVRLAYTVRQLRREGFADWRHAALARVRECLQREDFAAALEAIRPLRDHSARDLLVAYRLAQVLTGLGEVDAAVAAWQRVRALDRDGIYRAETRARQEALAGTHAVHRLPPADTGRA